MPFGWVRESELRDALTIANAANTQVGQLMALMREQQLMLMELARPAQPTPVPTPVPRAPHERSLSAEIIRQQAKGDPRLAAYLKGFAKQLKDDGKDDEEIAMELTQWYSTEGLLS